MKVVVTGGAGYVGSLVVAKLVERGHSVRVVDSLAGGESGLDPVWNRIEVVSADPRDVHARWLADVDAVVHLSGTVDECHSESDLESDWRASAVATERLAMACRAMGVPRMTYASTCEVYTHLPAGYEYNESAVVHPRSGPAVARYYAERRLQQLADPSFCPVILRHATPFGLSPRMFFETPPNRFVMEAVSHGRVALPRDAWIARPYVDVEDLAEAHVRCLEAPPSRVAGQVFNVVYANLRIREVGTAVAEVVGREGGPVRVTATDASAGTRDCRCSHARLREWVGFTPRRPLEAAVRKMATHLRARAPGALDPGAESSPGSRPGSPLFCVPAPRTEERISGSYTCWTGMAFD
jgi:nucleoside-diphosphate-sugar epimerase